MIVLKELSMEDLVEEEYDASNFNEVERTKFSDHETNYDINEEFFFIQNNKNRFSPETLTTDMKLLLFHWGCTFKQYTPNKAEKNGIKIFAIY
ncbi:hypothetical protein NPIL_376721 [Nephila pilipes]|uniref:Uncharacterized protein n=1 Tax=Nephila pilipes TaxID=299642 RepID=A0A8X6TJ69_NEPPI|nr:hypothetical protein NPIL_376721 [Nephila pilipes]